MRKFIGFKTAGAALALLAATAVVLPAQTFGVLHSFHGPDGAYPYAGLVQGSDGNLYGTASAWTLGDGTVFGITPTGRLTTLRSFDGTDGAYPYAGLVQGTNGTLYGTTLEGGANDMSCEYPGCGTIFTIASTGTLTTLYSFCSEGNCADGASPDAGLILATDGSFYGTTIRGGAGPCYDDLTPGCGTVFKISPSGTLTTLYSFCAQPGCTDGTEPESALVQGTDGNLYGTTSYGGNDSSPGGCGTLFKITTSGTLTTLYSFCLQSNCTDGEVPIGQLVQASDGNLYGTTSEGGVNGDGTVFKVTRSGSFTTIYSFCSQSNCPDGGGPNALIQATDGNFYGTTWVGGANNTCLYNGCGTVFKITPGGTLTTLHSFDGTDGADPVGALAQATDGNFYGTAEYGGANNEGTIFSLSMGLGPFVETQPTLGPVGVPVRILGTNLTGATSVTFNGVAAVFTVVSSSPIGATVPGGATTGTVQVVTPSGALSSNVPFRVRH